MLRQNETGSVTLPNKEGTPQSPLADKRLWIDFAVIFIVGLVLVQWIA